MENLKDALEYVVDLKDNEEKIVRSIEQSGKEYYDAKAHDLRELEPRRYPEPLKLSSLTSLVGYIMKQLDETGTYKNLLIHVTDHDTVEVKTELDDQSKRRVLAVAKAISPKIRYEQFLDVESFNIMMQTNFIPTVDSDVVLSFASSVKIDKGAEVADNGISQVTTIKTGVSTLQLAKAPNPVTLKPYRTFQEVDQPESKFVFRINDNPGCALFEADGGIWKAAAKANIAEYLHNNLIVEQGENAVENITILA